MVKPQLAKSFEEYSYIWTYEFDGLNHTLKGLVSYQNRSLLRNGLIYALNLNTNQEINPQIHNQSSYQGPKFLITKNHTDQINQFQQPKNNFLRNYKL